MDALTNARTHIWTDRRDGRNSSLDEQRQYLQWLSEQMECGNLQIGKPAVALWIPMTQK